MKRILTLLVLTFVAIGSGAQQPGNGKPPDLPEVDYHCADDAMKMFRDLCQKMESRDKESQRRYLVDQAEQAAERAIKAANDAKNAADNAAKVRSPDAGTRIDGITDSAKDLNSHFNNNPASQAVTEKSMSLINEFAQRENELLNQTQEKVQAIGTQGGSSSSSFNANEQHQLVERPHSTLDQEFEARERVLPSAPRELKPARITPTMQHPSLDREFQSREENLLACPTCVQAVANRERAVEAAAQAERDKEARAEAVRQAAIAERDRQIAEANRLAAEAESRGLDAEIAAEEREERREAAREARERQALLNAM